MAPTPSLRVVRPDRLHPAWRTALATVAAYLVLLAALFLLVFVVPYLAFAAA